jgi:hypothetical protein
MRDLTSVTGVRLAVLSGDVERLRVLVRSDSTLDGPDRGAC